jgi:hypothetical protein
MSELRLRDGQGRFVSETEENAYMNGILRGLAGGGAPHLHKHHLPTAPGNQYRREWARNREKMRTRK